MHTDSYELNIMLNRALDIFKEEQYPQIAQQLQQLRGKLQQEDNIKDIIAGCADIIIQVAALPERIKLFNRWFDDLRSKILVPRVVLKLAAELCSQAGTHNIDNILQVFSKTTSEQLKACRAAILAHLYTDDPDRVATVIERFLASVVEADQQEAGNILLYLLISDRAETRRFGRSRIDELMAEQSVLVLQVLLLAQQNQYIAVAPRFFESQIKTRLLRHVQMQLRTDPEGAEQTWRQLIALQDETIVPAIAELAHKLGKSLRKSSRAFKQKIVQMFIAAQQADNAAHILYDDVQSKGGRQTVWLYASLVAGCAIFLGGSATPFPMYFVIGGFVYIFTVPILIAERWYEILPNMSKMLHANNETLTEALVLATKASLINDLNQGKQQNGYLSARIKRYACSKDMVEVRFAAKVIVKVAITHHAEEFSFKLIKKLTKSFIKNRRKNAGIIMAQLMIDLDDEWVRGQLTGNCRNYKIETIETAILQLLDAEKTQLVDAIYMNWPDDVSQRQDLLIRLQASTLEAVKAWVESKAQLLAVILPQEPLNQDASKAATQRHSSWTEMVSRLGGTASVQQASSKEVARTAEPDVELPVVGQATQEKFTYDPVATRQLSL